MEKKYSGFAVVDLGCGDRAYIDDKEKLVLGLDLKIPDRFPYSNFIQADINRPPLRKGIFDSVICQNVLEHLEKPLRFLFSVNELIKEEGYVMLAIPNCYSFEDLLFRFLDRIYHFTLRRGRICHVQKFTLSRLSMIAETTGFRIEQIYDLPAGYSYLPKPIKRLFIVSSQKLGIGFFSKYGWNLVLKKIRKP